MFRRLVTKKLWLLLPVALMLTGCPAKVNPTPTPSETTFSLSPTEVELEATGGTFTVKVNCPTTYKLSSKPDWVKDNTTAGSGNVHTFSVGANPEYEVRKGVLVFCDDIGTCLPVMVNQKASAAGTIL